MKNYVSALEIFGALMLERGMASGNLVAAHMIVHMYLFLVLVFIHGPTQSIITQLKGSLKAGIGFKGAFAIVDLVYLLLGMSDKFLILNRVLLISKWPPIGYPCISLSIHPGILWVPLSAPLLTILHLMGP